MTDSRQPRLLLVDGHSMAYRAFFALPVENFSTRTGQPTNAVFGFTSMLINALRDETPTHVAVAFDVSRQTFRSEQYPEYKAGRATTREEFRGQVDLVKEVLAALRIVTVEREGYEADDVIATLTRQGREQGLEVLISSGDRDAFQLVSPTTTILYPIRGVSELTRMTPEAVEAKYGVPPRLYPDLAALVGETSDNLPGVPGVGPKTAAKWILQYDDLDGIVANVDQIGGKAGENLRAHLDQVIRNRRLNGLVDDLELSATIDDLKAQSWDREEVHRVFDGLEFRVLRDRLFEYLSTPEPEAEGGFELEVERPTGDAVATWLRGPGADGGALAVSGVLGIGGEATGVAVRTPAGASAWFDLGDPEHGGLGAGRARRPRRVARRPRGAQAPARRQAVAARADRRRPAARRPGRRHRPRGVPVASRPAHLRPRRPRRPAPAPRAAARRRRRPRGGPGRRRRPADPRRRAVHRRRRDARRLRALGGAGRRRDGAVGGAARRARGRAAATG